MENMGLDGFRPDEQIMFRIGEICSAIANLLSRDDGAERAIRGLEGSGIALANVPLGKLAEEILPVAPVLYSVRNAYRELTKLDYVAGTSYDKETVREARNLLGYTCLLGSFNAEVQLHESPTVEPVLVWGLRGTMQICGLAMQRVQSQETSHDLSEFAAGQNRIIHASNLAIERIAAHAQT